MRFTKRQVTEARQKAAAAAVKKSGYLGWVFFWLGVVVGCVGGHLGVAGDVAQLVARVARSVGG